MIKIECKVQIQNKDASKSNDPNDLLYVNSHWNSDRLVELKINDGDFIRVNGRDLIMAIENAMKSNRYGY